MRYRYLWSWRDYAQEVARRRGPSMFGYASCRTDPEAHLGGLMFGWGLI